MSHQEHQMSVTLGELCAKPGIIQTGPFGSQLHASDYSDSGVAVVMPQDISPRGFIDQSNTSRVPETIAQRLARYSLREDDIVYSRRGDVEKCALVTKNDLPALCGTGCLLVRVTPNAASARFLNYRLSMSETRAWISQHAVGATMPNLNTAILSAVPLTLPSLQKQQAIAEVLAALDEKIHVNRGVAHSAVGLASAEYEATRAKEIQSFSRFIGFEYGRSLPATRRSTGDVAVVGSGGITGHHDNALVDRPGIVVGRKGTMGSVHWLDDPHFPIDTTFWVTNNSTIPMHYWYFALQRAKLGELNSDSAVPGLNRDAALALMTPVPGPRLERFAQSAPVLFKAAAAARRESNALAQLRDTLLPALMDGRLRVRDAIEQAEEVL